MFVTVTENAHSQSHGIAHSPPGVIAKSNVILAAAREAAQQAGLGFAGIISPQDAWHLFSRRIALLIDVRSAEERKFIGHVPHSLRITWMTDVNLKKNRRFLRELVAKASKDDVILFLCSSGKRSAAAAESATKSGFRNAFNVAEGFEGKMVKGQRGLSGWRSYDLPWVQG